MAALGLVLLLPATTLALDPAKSVFQYNIRNWGRNDGLPSDKINAITQTKDGYLWFGSQNGLVRYDGIEFTAVPIQLPSAGGQDVASLAPGGEGGLWFAIVRGGFGYFDGHSFHPLDAKSSADSVDARAVLHGADGTLWFGGSRELGYIRPGAAFTRLDVAVPRIMTFAQGRSRVWMGTEEMGLYFWSDGRLQPAPDTTLKQQIILALAADQNGYVWVATQLGLRCYNSDGTLHSIELPQQRVTALLVDRHNILWVGTTEGVARYANGQFSFLRKSDGLASDYVAALFEDAEGSIWVGRLDGMSQISDLKFPIFSSKEGLPYASLAAKTLAGGLSVTGSRRGGVWLTTTHGLAYFDGQRFTTVLDESQLKNVYIKLGFEARNGDFYYADGDKTINVLSHGETVLRIACPNWPEAIVEDHESVVAGIGSALYRIKDGELRPYVFKGDVPNFEWFDNLYVARDGAIWVSSYAGVFRVKDGEYRRWSTENGLAGNRVHFIFEDVDGAIWAGLSNGMARIKDGKVRSITTAQGLVENRTYAIVPDDAGFFWIDSGRGICRVARTDLNEVADGTRAHAQVESFDGLDSVKMTDRVDQEASGCRSQDGRIWFPNPWGAVMIDPVNYARNRVPPPVHVEQVRVDDREIPDVNAPATLEVGDQRLEIHFAVLSYIAAPRVRVQYRLEGFEPQWVDAGTRRSASYQNLSPGTYRFRVRAANADGVWNESGDEFRFVLPPPFYRTLWFYAVCGLVAGAGIFSSYRWKLRHMELRQQNLQEQNQVLEDKVARRTEELASSLSLLQATLNSTADGILAVELGSGRISYNSKYLEMWQMPVTLAEGAQWKTLADFSAKQVVDVAAYQARILELQRHPDTEQFDVLQLKDGRTFERYSKPRRIGSKTVGIVLNFRDVTERRRAEQQLAEFHRQLLETSRHAGMAEVATNVLHNVGNVLNSVNVSGAIAADQVRSSKVVHVARIGALLQEHSEDLATFLRDDPKGAKIADYLLILGAQLTDEQRTLLEELEQMRNNIEHINEIVAMQQSYASVSGVSETVPLIDIVEHALQMNRGAIAEEGIEIVRDYRAEPAVTVERHKVMQILVNLVRNATQACERLPSATKRITVQVVVEDGRVRVSIIDTGVGIAPEHLTRIFSHGFTTKKDGHGFGLHSAALIAKELGGSLSAASDGRDRGATFTLELPVEGSTATAE